MLKLFQTLRQLVAGIQLRFKAAPFLFTSFIGIMGGSVSASGPADSYPTGPITFIVPFTAGGTTDIVARVIAKRLSESWSRPVLVENKAGGGGVIGTSMVVKSRPDGLTVLIAPSALGIRSGVSRNLPFDASKALQGVGALATAPSFLIVPATLSLESAKDLVEHIRGLKEGGVYASAGVGTSGHIHAALFADEAGLKMIHVPYKGTPEAVTDVISGRVTYAFAPGPNVLPFVRDGRVRVLGATSQTGVKMVDGLTKKPPEVVKDGFGDDWFAAFVPAGTPIEVRRKLNLEMNRILALPATIEAFRSIGAIPSASTPEALDNMFRGYISTARQEGERIGISLD